MTPLLLIHVHDVSLQNHADARAANLRLSFLIEQSDSTDRIDATRFQRIRVALAALLIGAGNRAHGMRPVTE